MAVSFFSPTNSSYLCNLIPSCNTTLNLVDYVFKTFLESQQVDETSQSTPLASERSSFVHNCSLAIYVIFGAVVAYYYYKPVTLKMLEVMYIVLKALDMRSEMMLIL